MRAEACKEAAGRVDQHKEEGYHVNREQQSKQSGNKALGQMYEVLIIHPPATVRLEGESNEEWEKLDCRQSISQDVWQ